MALNVNPEKDSADQFEKIGEGRKLSHAVGINRWTAGTGTEMMTMGFVVLRDVKGGNDKGKVFMERFAITQKAIFRLARWAVATGYKADFDAENDEDIKKIMARGAIVATFELGAEYKGNRRVEVQEWAAYTGEHDPSWDSIIQEGEQEYERILQRMENARNNPSPEATGGYGGGGQQQKAEPAGQHDDIPF